MRYILITASLFVFLAGKAQLLITTGNPVTIVNDYFSGCNVLVSNVTYSGQNGSTGASQIGLFSNGNSTNIGMSDGIILTTGDVMMLDGPVGDFSSSDMMGTGDLDLTNTASASTYDAAVVEMDAIPGGDSLYIRYIFGSEEYPEFVNAGYNDVFALFITGPNPAGGNYVNYNIARVPNTNTPVSIDNVHSGLNSLYYVDNQGLGGAYIVLDGFTVPLYGAAHVYPDSTYHIKIAVADAGDHIYDSAVFLEVYSLSVGNTAVNPLQVSTGQSGHNCPGQTNVHGWASASGGFQPYEYLWSNGHTDSDMYNMASGIYTVTVTDFSGCHVVKSLRVQDSQVSASYTEVQPSCGNDNGSITVNMGLGAFPPFTYLWSTGQTHNSASNTDILDSLGAGAYYVTVVNGLGCNFVGSMYLSSQNSPVISADDFSDPGCAGNDGYITVYTDSGGASPYIYDLNGTQIITGADSACFSGLSMGYYVLTITDTNNCSVVNSYILNSVEELHSSFIYSSYDTSVAFFNYSSPGNYLWQFDDGSTSNEINPNHIYQGPGTYNVCLTVFGVCDTVVSCETVAIYLTTIQETTSTNYSIRIFPNPMTTSATLTIPNLANSQWLIANSLLKITDLTGKIVSVENIIPSRHSGLDPESSQLTIERGDLKPGIYFIELNAGRTYRGKLVAE